METKVKTKEEVNLEIEMLLNENLFTKKIITEDMYKKVNEKLLKMIENLNRKNVVIDNTG
ncbi:MAG: hypothetical protein J6K23_04845 [Bacilli bacterium]|nr:hypothetical protein [Bacillota bacterium]MBP3445245.1 hypothetical protein [Bacilli bacterium]